MTSWDEYANLVFFLALLLGCILLAKCCIDERQAAGLTPKDALQIALLKEEVNELYANVTWRNELLGLYEGD